MSGSDTEDVPISAHRLLSARAASPFGRSREAELILGPALLEAVRQVVRGELEASRASVNSAPASPWMTPPRASLATRVPVKTIRAWAKDGRIQKRLKNRAADPKQQKYLVNLEEIVRLAEQAGAQGHTAGEGDRAERRRVLAEQILAARAAKGR